MTHPIPLGRRAFVALAASPLAAAAAEPEPDPDQAGWDAFKARFLTPDGRVVDTGNADVSHTEGQGWGLWFAVIFDDREAFDRIDNWTHRTLARPNDALHMWRFRPGAANPVDDPNNATDGDLFIAAALARAGARWTRPELTRRAQAIAESVLALLVRQVGGLTLLAPGVDGFAKDGGALVVNPSYYAFPALDVLARLRPDPAWARLREDGVALLGRARFGTWQLPPDWALATAGGQLVLAPDQPPRFGYDAVRVPLYLAWAGIDSPVLAAVGAWWRQAAPQPPPAWVDLRTGATAEYPAGPGMAAAMRTAIGEDADIPPIDASMDYYTAALCLLARTARRDISAGRTAAGPR